MSTEISKLKVQLANLIDLRDSGVVSAEQFDQSAAQIERKIVDEVMKNESLPSEPEAQPEASKSSSRFPLKLLISVAAILSIVALGVFWTRPSIQTQPIQEQQVQDASPQPHATNQEQIDAMVGKLAARLKENPKDVAGWAMLARSYSVLGKVDEAVDAYAKAVKLSKDDAGLLVDYADALAVKNNRNLAGEPVKLVERALKLDARNVKALALSGTAAFDRKDYRMAVKQWELVESIGGPDNMFTKQTQSSLAEARDLAGMPAKAAKVQDKPVSAGSSVRGTVTLAANLISKTSPDETLFITARPVIGSRMPLAVLRKQVKDLPLTFILDDSMAMGPDTKISTASEVIVTARISKSGTAMPLPGDFSVQSAPVRVGTTDLKIEISESTKPLGLVK
jgi:cytochrome c-type biogenesis protein CcmH